MTLSRLRNLLLACALMPGAAHALGGAEPPGAHLQTHAFVWRDGLMTDLGTLGGSYSAARGINALGQVVGVSTRADGQGRAFIWQDGTMRDLGTLGGVDSVALGISDAGVVVGASTMADGARHAFRWQDGTMLDLGTLDGGRNSEARAINNAGQIVGISQADFGATPRAFLWQDGAMVGLGRADGSASTANDINDSGQVAGTADVLGTGSYAAVVWASGGMQALDGFPSGSFSFGNGISNQGQVVGAFFEPQSGQPSQAFVWSTGQLVGLAPGYPYGGHVAVDINNSGQVVGNSDLSPDAFIWTDGVPIRLGSLGGPAAYGITRAAAINADGLVVGDSQVTVTAVPEPAGWLLMGLGGGWLAALRRRSFADAQVTGRARSRGC